MLTYITPAVVIILFMYLLHKWHGYLLYRKLSTQINEADLPFFKDILGESYQYRHSARGHIKCKWITACCIVKASFDSDQKLIVAPITRFSFFSIRNRIIFS